MKKLKLVISGAQNGVDIAGLEVAKKFGLETGGTMPFGYKTLDGCKPEYKDLYGVTFHKSSSYAPRTRQNVEDSDGTLRLATDFTTPGEKCTIKAVKACKKLNLDVDLNDPLPQYKVAQWIIENKIGILNIAGNSERSCPGIYDIAYEYLLKVFISLDLHYKIGK